MATSSSSSPPPEMVYLAHYLIQLVLPSSKALNQELGLELTRLIIHRFIPNHWFPSQPERGSGYRAICFDLNRHDPYLDPILSILSRLLGFSHRQFRKMIKSNPHLGQSSFTIWCDPGCVSLKASGSNGIEVKELWGSLPSHLIHLLRPSPQTPSSSSHSTRIPIQSPQPPSTITRPSSPLTTPSPHKSLSRAIPILAPSSALRLAGLNSLALIPPTPIHPNRPPFSGRCSPIESTTTPSVVTEEDPFLRPSSRTSSTSSSSDGSDRSAFSISSSSTATSISPRLPLCQLAVLGKPMIEQPSYLRHQATHSVPFMNHHPHHRPATPTHYPTSNRTLPTTLISSSGNLVKRKTHGTSASISSMSGRRGMLVLKEGPGTVTEHSGGKVGVMGGGVLLGLPKDSSTLSSSTTTMVVNDGMPRNGTMRVQTRRQAMIRL